MFGKIAAFELRYQLRQPVFYVAAIVFFLLSFGSVASEFVGLGAGGNVNRNAPYVVALGMAIFGLFYMLVTAAFVANVVIRDDATGYGPIVRSTPVRKFDYLFGRFTGAFAAVLLSFLSIPLGFITGSFMPWVDPETIGPFRPGDYVHSYLLWGAPALLLTSSLFFALATVTRSMMATYVGVIGLLVAFTVAGNYLDRPQFEDAAALFEPFGSAAFGQATEYWTPAERNTRNVPLTGVVVANRLFSLALSLGALALAYGLFRFEVQGRAARRKEKLARLERAEAPPAPAGPLPRPAFGRGAAWAVLAKRTRFELAQVFKSPAFFILLLLGVFLAGLTLWALGEVSGTRTYPVTRLMITGIEGAFGAITVIVATYYAGELVWRERERRVHEITDSTAVPDWAFVVPKTLAIMLVLVSLSLVGVATGMAVQLLKGWTELEPGQYFGWYVLPFLFDIFTLSALAVFAQVISPNKFAGWGVMVLYFIASITLSAMGLDHPLYTYGAASPVPLSDMNGQGDFRGYATWFDLYWSAFALLLLVLAYALYRRGSETRYGPRLRRLPRRLAGAPGLIAGGAVAAFAGLGVFIYINTNVWNDYRSAPGWDRYSADYEKTLLRFETTPQPSVATVVLDVELHPHENRAVTRGRYLLENRTGAPLREVHLRRSDTDTEFTSLSVEGARQTRLFEPFEYRIFTFDRPMAPGERRTVRFETVLGQRGFRARRYLIDVVDNGTFANNFSLTPAVGMTRNGLLQDRAKRRKYGLPAELRMAKLEDADARRFNYLNRADWVRSDITVSTVADQTPMAPGYKVSDVTHGGRRTARFVTEAPILHFFSVQSARYAVRRDNYAGVELAIYHHPGHDENVERMIRALRAGLDYYSEAFGPYQFRQARIIEFPYRSFAQAFANTMPYSENVGFIADLSRPDGIDYVTYVTAHELAHQWWAHQIIGADVQGATTLSETLANYSALMVMKRLYGPDQMRRYLKYELDQYLAARGQEVLEELPLYRVENQGHIHYQKGSLVMYLLQDEIGEDRVNAALRRVLEAYKFKGAPYPTSLDLVRALRAQAGPEHQDLITDLFQRITLYDLKTTEASKRRLPDGRWEVSMTVEAEKVYADGQGEETEAPLNEAMDVGVFTAPVGEGAFDRRDVVLFEQRPIRSGTQKLTVVVNREPTHVGVDPYNKRIDRDSDDNVRSVG